MSSRVRTQYRAIPMGVDETYKSDGQSVGAFIAATAGNVKIATLGTGARTVLAATPVAAGARLDLEILVEQAQGFNVVLSGGASGTLLV